eukprot:SAG31_NODE_11613_length_1013_cov_1.356674_1_plen_48_part_10
MYLAGYAWMGQAPHTRGHGITWQPRALMAAAVVALVPLPPNAPRAQTA